MKAWLLVVIWSAVLFACGDTADEDYVAPPTLVSGSPFRFATQSPVQTLFVTQVLGRGETFRASDGSVWEITAFDQPVVRYWAPGDQVSVFQPDGTSFPYRMENANTRTSAHGRPLTRRP